MPYKGSSPALVDLMGGQIQIMPTLDEAGLKGFDVSSWFGLMSPAGAPSDIIATHLASAHFRSMDSATAAWVAQKQVVKYRRTAP